MAASMQYHVAVETLTKLVMKKYLQLFFEQAMGSYLIKIKYPNQPHLLNKYQINMGFSHFHEFGILSGIYILAPYQIDIVKDVVSAMTILY